jgi:hypothetical protein
MAYKPSTEWQYLTQLAAIRRQSERRALLRRIAGAGGLLGLCGSQSALAKALYSYRDENGVLHLSDVPPETEQPVKMRPIRILEPDKLLQVHKRGRRETPRIEVDNRYHGPVEVEFSFSEAENLIADPPLPLRIVVPGAERITAFSIRAAAAGEWRYSYRYRWGLGDPRAEHRPGRPYALPYARGRRYRIAQAFAGTVSHSGPMSRYAVDFAMPEGSPVHAARGGMIMQVAEDFLEGGFNRDKFINRANLVRVLHDDGSMAVYAHLKWESVVVRPGQKVRRGERLAASGNTGYSTGPHLHFAVQLNRQMKLRSVPFVFTSREHEAVEPNQGMLLTAV